METVIVYGIDHSPWVQTVLLALEDQKIPYQMVHYPLSYFRHGLVFPVCFWPHKSVKCADSFAIMKMIRCESEVKDQTESNILTQQQKQLEKLFLSYVLTRATWGNHLNFIKAWAQTADHTPHLGSYILSHVIRAFVMLYFLFLINIAILVRVCSRMQIYHDHTMRKHLSEWDHILSQQAFLSGDEIGDLDYALLGHIQCMATGLTDYVLDVVREYPHLVGWLQQMHQRFTHYDRLYSRRIFDPQVKIKQAHWSGQLLFYVSLCIQIYFASYTLILLASALLLRYRNAARTSG